MSNLPPPRSSSKPKTLSSSSDSSSGSGGDDAATDKSDAVAPFAASWSSDLTLATADGASFNVHRAIVESRMGYLTALANSGMRDAHAARIEFNDISGSVLKTLIDWCYGAELRCTHDDAIDVLDAAYRLDCGGAISVVQRILAQNIDVENVFDLLEIARSKHARLLTTACEIFATVAYVHDFASCRDSFRAHALWPTFVEFRRQWRLLLVKPTAPCVARTNCDLSIFHDN